MQTIADRGVPTGGRGPLGLNRYQLTVLLLCALTFLVEGFDMQTMALAVPTIAPEWGMSPSSFGLAISALNMGAVISSAFLAPWGDRIGRRRIIAVAVMLMGTGVAFTATATDVWHLVAWRLASGLGFGAAVANLHALIAEQFPPHRRALFVTIAIINLSMGGIVGGFLTEPITLAAGWQGLFLVGGAGGIIMGALIWLVVRDERRITDVEPPVLVDGKRVRPSVRMLLTREFIGITIPLWLIKLLNASINFVLLSWLPTMLSSIGWSLGEAARGSATMQIGGIAGGILLSMLLDRGQARTALMASFGGMIIVFALFSLTPATILIWSILLVIGGGLCTGTHHALNALAATIYPDAIRATGAGWANAMSRIGSISGSLIGALLLHIEMPVASVISLLAVPAFLAIVLSIVLDRARRARQRAAAQPQPA